MYRVLRDRTYFVFLYLFLVLAGQAIAQIDAGERFHDVSSAYWYRLLLTLVLVAITWFRGVYVRRPFIFILAIFGGFVQLRYPNGLQNILLWALCHFLAIVFSANKEAVLRDQVPAGEGLRMTVAGLVIALYVIFNITSLLRPLGVTAAIIHYVEVVAENERGLTVKVDYTYFGGKDRFLVFAGASGGVPSQDPLSQPRKVLRGDWELNLTITARETTPANYRTREITAGIGAPGGGEPLAVTSIPHNRVWRPAAGPTPRTVAPIASGPQAQPTSAMAETGSSQALSPPPAGQDGRGGSPMRNELEQFVREFINVAWVVKDAAQSFAFLCPEAAIDEADHTSAWRTLEKGISQRGWSGMNVAAVEVLDVSNYNRPPANWKGIARLFKVDVGIRFETPSPDQNRTESVIIARLGKGLSRGGQFPSLCYVGSGASGTVSARR